MNQSVERVFLDYGFRLFFLGAALWSIFDIVIWAGFYSFHQPLFLVHLAVSPAAWHGFEMVYGYGAAVATGFLLTAVVNWTGKATLSGRMLGLLFLAWCTARTAPVIGSLPGFILARGLDVLVLAGSGTATLQACLRTGQRPNAILVGLFFGFMTAGQILFFLGALSVIPGSGHLGLYLGLYTLVLLTLVISQRVIPFFIKASSGGQHPLGRSRSGALLLPLLAVFIICELVPGLSGGSCYVALLLVPVMALRGVGWCKRIVWQRALLWILLLGYGWFLVGFLLKALSLWVPMNPFLPVHAFTVGGIGTMTLGMMSRVTLGHTGRNINQPPRGISLVFGGMALLGIIRVMVPLVLPALYAQCVMVSQGLWLVVFSSFLFLYTPLLTTRIVRPESLV